MDAGACAAGRSSYATGNEATRRIHGGGCPVGRRSREGVGFCESEDSYERGLAAFVGGTTTAYHFRSGAAALPLSL